MLKNITLKILYRFFFLIKEHRRRAVGAFLQELQCQVLYPTLQVSCSPVFLGLYLPDIRFILLDIRFHLPDICYPPLPDIQYTRKIFASVKFCIKHFK